VQNAEQNGVFCNILASFLPQKQ